MECFFSKNITSLVVKEGEVFGSAMFGDYEFNYLFNVCVSCSLSVVAYLGRREEAPLPKTNSNGVL